MAYTFINSYSIFLFLFQKFETNMRSSNDKLIFESGQEMKNRFMLAPLTNTQSHEDGTLSDDEYKWLTKRAEGGFGITMSCASHIQEIGKGFPGQLGIFDDKHIEGLKKLTAEIKKHDSLAIAQLHHAGMRSPEKLIKTQPVCPSDDSSTPLLFFGIPLNEDGTKKNKGVSSPNNFPFKLRKVRSAVSDVKLIGISLLVM